MTDQVEVVAVESEAASIEAVAAEGSDVSAITWADVWSNARLAGLQSLVLIAGATADVADAGARVSRKLQGEAARRLLQAR